MWMSVCVGLCLRGRKSVCIVYVCVCMCMSVRCLGVCSMCAFVCVERVCFYDLVNKWIVVSVCIDECECECQ